MKYSEKSQPAYLRKDIPLRKLTPEQVRQIDELLASLGEYGEIHLIVQRGELKYVNKVESQRAWKDAGPEETAQSPGEE